MVDSQLTAIQTSPHILSTEKQDDMLIFSPPAIPTTQAVNPFDFHTEPEKVNPLLAFDPLLQGDGPKKTSPTGVYSDLYDLNLRQEHPLLMTAETPISTNLPSRRKTVRSHRSHKSLGANDLGGIFKSRTRGHTVHEGDLLEMVLSTDSSDHAAPMLDLSEPSKMERAPKVKNHRKSNSISSMAEFGGLFKGRARGHTVTEGDLSKMRLNMDSSGHAAPMLDSSESSRMERPPKVKNHRKSNSISSMAELVSSFGHSSATTTPHASPGRPPKGKTLTPTRMPHRGSANNSPKAGEIAPTPALPGLHIPLLAKPSPTSLLLEGDDLALRTSEQEPSSHQVDMPEANHVAVHAKLCALMDSYRLHDPAFSFSSLVGVPNLALREFAFFGKGSLQSSPGMEEKHQPILKALLECAEGITVEGYTAMNAEVAIFEIPALSQIVGVFRGCDERQVKPFSTKQAKLCTSTDVLSPDQNVTVVPVFREAYFDLEPRFYTLIDKLTDGNPFAKIVLCGHSFGAALATLAAVRYASFRPTMMVAAHVFGSPKVGAANFRLLANSISNLKIIRVETKDDPIIHTPADTTNKKKWDHVGHSIVVGSKHGVTAYRFEHNKPAHHTSSIPLFRKVERDSKAYVAALKTCVEKEQWVKDFVGEDVGDGVLGKNAEKRLMV